MLKIVAKQVVKEECIAEYQKITAELVEKSNAEEGCIAYELVQSNDDPKVHAFIEVWKDQAAHKLHSETEHFVRIVGQIGKLIESEDVLFAKQIH